MVKGRYFDAASSAASEAELESAGMGHWVLRVGDHKQHLDPATLRISERIGRIPRRVRLPEGAEFETDDNDGVDELLQAGGVRQNWVHALERRWGVAIGALVAVGLISVLFVRFGLPAISKVVAVTLPPSADRLLGMQTLQFLDRGFMKPSELSAQRQAALQTLFKGMTATLRDGHVYRLELRKSKAMGPNALALPSGIVVMTDELVNVAQNDEQIAAVLAHEIGHVRGRHALRLLIQSAGVSALALVVLGDVSSVTALASAAPVLIQAKHSRDFEREADDFARHWLEDQGIPQRRFDEILCEITKAAGAGKNSDAPAFLSTHPATRERAHCKP
jgi:Zn-dependent protease with chaperone function